MDSNETLELENKLLHPTSEPISLRLGFLESITSNVSKEQEIGSGANGVVYKGLLHRGDSFIAVKKIHDYLVVQHEEHFQKEAISLKGIQHPNVIKLLGYCWESKGEMIKLPNGKYVIAEKPARMLCFEYMCNGGLDKYLADESSGLEWNRRYEIIKGICSGLHFLHECDIVHLDLKPQNILIDSNMMPKIADFGLSRLLVKQKCNTVTVTSDRTGTIGYMAPEYISKGHISKKADIFSLGVIMIEILTGCRECPRSTETDIQQFIEKVLNNWRNRFERASEYTSLELHTQQVKQCIKIALKCMHFNRKKRPNALDIIKFLDPPESTSCLQNGEDLSLECQMESHEGVLPQDVWREDELLALYRSGMADIAPPARISEDVWNEETLVVAPPQPQGEPVLACPQHNEGSLATLCYRGTRNASFWVAHKALISLEDNVLKDWAATINLGPSVEALEQELRSVKVILELTLGKVIHNFALEDTLMVLRELVYDAEDVLNEMEYFRIQGNVLDDGQHADLNVLPSIHDEPLELRFDRHNASRRIEHIVEKMQFMLKKVKSAIILLGSDWSTAPNIAKSRPTTNSESIEPKLYGRELMMKSIIDDITKGQYSGELLTVIPIVGPGGIGKTTLAQHIYHRGEVQKHFHVRVWTCVSLNFNVNKLIEEIQRYIPAVDHESSNGTVSELIGQRLKNKRLLLVLDDIWDCSDEDQWKQLLVPFQKSQVQGNIIIVTTRFPAQAQIMARIKDHSIYLQGIENKDFEELFLQIIFGDDDQSRKDHRFLLETGVRIAAKLKGSPLAAKTVGRLLKTELDLDHWTRILESKEWEHSDGKNDIMPALKLSFEYLPCQLQQCFSYCALFPQDYKFERQELINFWIGQEVLHSSHGENKRVEVIGLSCLTQLVNYGFFLENKGRKDERTYYIIHDLLHELAQKVSSHECLSIDSCQSQVSSLQIPPSIRHLSINIDDNSVVDRLARRTCAEDFNSLDKKIKVEKLRSLMLFGNHHGCFLEAFRNLFREAVSLRVFLLSNASYDVENLLHNFYNLVHLRYLRIEGHCRYHPRFSTTISRFPNKISRFYQMVVLDVRQCDIIYLPRDMSKLAKLRHFLVNNGTTHSSIAEVGKLKSLQELRSFVVRQEDHQGFELSQIGHLKEICGSLCIDNLENVKTLEDADEAKLMQKSGLHELKLCWSITRSTSDSTLEEHVLERLRPSSRLSKLSIKGHRGTTCPSWLGTNLSVGSLESLCLECVAWKNFPPIGELWLVDLPREEYISGSIPDRRFGNLRRLKLVNLPYWRHWVIHAPCQLFPFLEVLIIKDCPQLVKLSFQHISCGRQGKEENVNLFPRLKKLKIINCLQLSSFPPVPWSEAPCSIKIERIGSSCFRSLNFGKTLRSESEYGLTIFGKEGTNDGTFIRTEGVLAFHNLTRLKELQLFGWDSLPLHYLQMLSSLRKLSMSCLSDAFPFAEADSHVKYQFPVECLIIDEWNASGKELTQLLAYFPKLSDLSLDGLKKVTGLALNVKGQRATETPSSEKAECGLLLLPPQLQGLRIYKCPELSLQLTTAGAADPHDDSNEEDGRSGGGGGLQGLTSLRVLEIWGGCPNFLSAYSSSSFNASSFPFPNSLEHLRIWGEVGTEVLLPLSNLTCLTNLILFECEDLTVEGLLSLLAQGHLTELHVRQASNFFVDPEHSQVHEQDIPSCSSKLQVLEIDDVAGFTTASIHHSLIFSSLNTMVIGSDNKLEHFTEQQEALLFVNSLEEITFRGCRNLQSLPKRLHELHNLKRLIIWGCDTISLLKVCLPDSLQSLQIVNCPAIRSFPEVDDLPSSLREIDVGSSKSEELKSHCRKFINIIPVVRTY